MKEIRRVNIYILAASALLLASCSKDWMEIKADQSQSVPKTLQDYRSILDNFSIFSTSPCLTEVASDYHFITESMWASIKNSNQGNAYIWQENTPYKSVTDWSTSYTGIFHANIALEGVESLRGKENPSDLDQLKGAALFQRGRLFYYLAMTFSPAYDKASTNQQPGIPLRLNTNIEEPTKRSTVQQTYDQILSDIKSAEALLPDQSNYVIRPSKVSANGLLSRIYMAMEEYDSAFHYANKYLEVSDSLIDFNTLSLTQNFIGPSSNVEARYFSLLLRESSLNTFLFPASFYDEYDENDLRKKVFFRPSSGTYSFKGSYSLNTNDKFAGIATDEMLLNRSECYARKNEIMLAMKDLNDLLRSRYAKNNGTSTFIDYVITDQTEALRLILKERKKQLILRNVRWSDLRRLNRDTRFAETITRSVGGNTYTLEPNSYKYTFPIPNDIIALSGIEQNKGWKN